MGASDITARELAAAPEPLKPWRELCDSDNKKAEDKLRSNIKQNNSTDFKITLVGNSGAGKSSFINSAFSISRRRIADVVRVKGEAVSGIGTFSFDGERAGPDDLFPSVVFLDTMGFSRSDGNKCNGISEEDLKRVCNGEIRIGHKFNVDSAKATTNKYRPNCVIFVVSAEIFLHDFNSTNIVLKEKMGSLYHCVPIDIPRIAVLTKCDNICNDTAKDASNIFKSRIVERVVKKAATTLGLQENKVFPIVNYTKEVELKTTMNVPILYAVQFALNFARDNARSQLPDED
ncbi:interferon-induced protein 44-like isoform X2 [Mya arenaria]|uniref:interferon-induced protein 44-like isoform X2 n=1 Tax=Mya arenaria TaxID=6604 RepID=UPI0022E27ADE|nr:interferon-induced protein 44-like isoform X2 [Mya arenaria]